MYSAMSYEDRVKHKEFFGWYFLAGESEEQHGHRTFPAITYGKNFTPELEKTMDISNNYTFLRPAVWIKIE